MFGYHDSNRCAYDIWSPVDAGPCAIENRAFSPYCKHTTELEQIIEIFCENARTGNYEISIETDEFLSESDWEYIHKEVERRLC